MLEFWASSIWYEFPEYCLVWMLLCRGFLRGLMNLGLDLYNSSEKMITRNPTYILQGTDTYIVLDAHRMF
jgi:hypothetical protein